MKKLVIGLLIITGALAVAPYFIGMQAQTRLETGLETLTDMTGELYDIKLEDYERGWFASTGKVRYSMSDAYVQSNPVLSQANDDGKSFGDMLTDGFTQEITVAHGPILWGPHLALGLARVENVIAGAGIPEVEAAMKDMGLKYFVRTQIFLDFTGSGSLEVDAPSFEYQIPGEETEILFAGAKAKGAIALADMHIVADGVIHGFSAQAPPVDYASGPMKFSFDMRYPESDPYGLGYAKITMDRFLFIDTENNNSFDMAGISFNTNSEKTAEGMVDFGASYRVDRLQAPEVNLSNMALGASLGNVRSSTVVGLQESMTTLQAASTDPANLDPQAALAAISDPAYDLIADGATVAFDPISFTMNDQPFSVSMRLQSKPENLPERAAFDFSNPLLFMGLFKVHTTMSANRDLVIEMAMPQLKEQMRAGVPECVEVSEEQLEAMVRAQAPMMIGALVGQGYIREEGDMYTLEATFDNGELTLNGTPLPLGALLGAGGDAPALSSR